MTVPSPRFRAPASGPQLSVPSPSGPYVYVYSLDDLPPPSDGNIQLADNTTYKPVGRVPIGLNGLTYGEGTAIVGDVFGRDGFERSEGATGALLTIPDVEQNVNLSTVSLVSPAGHGTLLDADCPNANIFLNRVSFSGDIGVITRATVIDITASSLLGWDSGLVLGDNVSFNLVASSMRQVAGGTGIGLDFQGASLSNIDIVQTAFAEAAGGTAIQALANNANLPGEARGVINLYKFLGSGTALSNFTVDDLKWTVSNGNGIAGSLAVGSLKLDTPAPTPTVGTAWTKVLGTTVALRARRFSHADNSLTSLSLDPKSFRVDVEILARASSNGAAVNYGISINDAAPVESIPEILSNNSDTATAFFLDVGTLNTGDKVEVWCQDPNGAGVAYTANGLRVLVSALATGT